MRSGVAAGMPVQWLRRMQREVSVPLPAPDVPSAVRRIRELEAAEAYWDHQVQVQDDGRIRVRQRPRRRGVVPPVLDGRILAEDGRCRVVGVIRESTAQFLAVPLSALVGVVFLVLTVISLVGPDLGDPRIFAVVLLGACVGTWWEHRTRPVFFDLRADSLSFDIEYELLAPREPVAGKPVRRRGLWRCEADLELDAPDVLAAVQSIRQLKATKVYRRQHDLLVSVRDDGRIRVRRRQGSREPRFPVLRGRITVVDGRCRLIGEVRESSTWLLLTSFTAFCGVVFLAGAVASLIDDPSGGSGDALVFGLVPLFSLPLAWFLHRGREKAFVDATVDLIPLVRLELLPPVAPHQDPARIAGWR